MTERRSTPALWHPLRAWCLAGLYLAASVLLAQITGTLSWLCRAPLPDAPVALALAALCTGIIVVAYGLIWPRGSFTDGRARHPLALLFGLGWGLAQGLVFLMLWRAVATPGWPALFTVGVAFVVIASYAALFQQGFWDRWVSPPHNLRAWNLRKVLLCHTPNLLATLAFLAWSGSALLFLLWQMLALVLASLAMRMPPPWSGYRALAGEQR